MHSNHLMRAEDFHTVISQTALVLPFIIALVLYITCVVISNRHRSKWPMYRNVLFIIANLCVLATVTGPISIGSYHNFGLHMFVHLVLGMLTPLLFVFSAPMTLLLRTLNVKTARILTRLFNSALFRFVSSPVTASILNIGGLWVLYTSDLYTNMHQNVWIHLIVHYHVFLAGYLFTTAFIYIEPRSHQNSFMYRAVVMVFALTGHNILAKHIYSHPPTGVHAEQAETGGMLMYYGGDVIDLILIFILCYQWYRAARPHQRVDTFSLQTRYSNKW